MFTIDQAFVNVTEGKGNLAPLRRSRFRIPPLTLSSSSFFVSSKYVNIGYSHRQRLMSKAQQNLTGVSQGFRVLVAILNMNISLCTHTKSTQRRNYNTTQIKSLNTLSWIHSPHLCKFSDMKSS